jgi:hypothetical protein
MFKLVTVAVLSTVATSGLVFAAVTATHDGAGELGFLSSVSTVAVIVAFLALVVGLLERTNRRAFGPAGRAPGRDARNDRDTGRTLDELRAVSGTAGGAPARHTRLSVM